MCPSRQCHQGHKSFLCIRLYRGAPHPDGNGGQHRWLLPDRKPSISRRHSFYGPFPHPPSLFMWNPLLRRSWRLASVTVGQFRSISPIPWTYLGSKRQIEALPWLRYLAEAESALIFGVLVRLFCVFV